jgi:DNA invertase Pin-like site-specific DNA recombinase
MSGWIKIKAGTVVAAEEESAVEEPLTEEEASELAHDILHNENLETVEVEASEEDKGEATPEDDLIEKVAAKVSKKAGKAISRKMKRLMREKKYRGSKKKRKQAVAISMSVAREKGYEVPEPEKK